MLNENTKQRIKNYLVENWWKVSAKYEENGKPKNIQLVYKGENEQEAKTKAEKYFKKKNISATIKSIKVSSNIGQSYNTNPEYDKSKLHTYVVVLVGTLKNGLNSYAIEYWIKKGNTPQEAITRAKKSVSWGAYKEQVALDVTEKSDDEMQRMGNSIANKYRKQYGLALRTID